MTETTRPTRLRRAPGRALLAAIALTFAAGTMVACKPVPGEPLDIQSGHGITVHGFQQLAGSQRTWVVDISTDSIHANSVNGLHQVRITLPTQYFDNNHLRYPVLYLLHGGAGGSSRQWTTEGGAAEFITTPYNLITVMPDGGKVGWFTDWVNTAEGAQAWQQFHLNQLIPWIDANLRTADHRLARAVAGLSMGGYGAIRYAAERPDLFSYAASFSGAVNVVDAGTRTVIAQQTTSNGFPSNGPFGTYGGADSTWDTFNPVNRAADLADVHVALYTGSGTWALDILEGTMATSAAQMHQSLNAAGVDHFYWNYGRNPQPNAFSCDGGHNWGCWNFALQHAMPDMMDRLIGP